ncbi:putative conserved membrane protein [Synechococcus sp. PROS-7-1]|uniref:hypothetical protein n=1 Tax=unclassified Synechococcus TaxID=2626047 RepID=UPI00164750CE|nr:MULTISPECIES: hypothetical protein [unclassified Synechococcus]QNI68032.1 putative conserved membrane protein [Synechococcus sp. BMK-MC-1]QNI85680.1 putative conserved membrane protein [Synechococcus sp. PROS-7-1]
MCLLAALGLLAPRLILILLWVFSPLFVLAPFADLPIPNPILPLLGVLFLPTTTLGVCFAQASFGGLGSFSGLLVVAIGLVIDAGLIGNGRGLAKR